LAASVFIILSLFLYLVTGHLPTEHKSDLGHIGKVYKGRKDHNNVSFNRIFRLIGRYKKNCHRDSKNGTRSRYERVQRVLVIL